MNLDNVISTLLEAGIKIKAERVQRKPVAGTTDTTEPPTGEVDEDDPKVMKSNAHSALHSFIHGSDNLYDKEGKLNSKTAGYISKGPQHPDAPPDDLDKEIADHYQFLQGAKHTFAANHPLFGVNVPGQVQTMFRRRIKNSTEHLASTAHADQYLASLGHAGVFTLEHDPSTEKIVDGKTVSRPLTVREHVAKALDQAKEKIIDSHMRSRYKASGFQIPDDQPIENALDTYMKPEHRLKNMENLRATLHEQAAKGYAQKMGSLSPGIPKHPGNVVKERPDDAWGF